ncbi:MAG: 2-C-methyl-D-erythritol 4-phosphate cytidylyltransferase [Tepidisphaerales bacterium]
MANFSVILLTAPPPGLASDIGGYLVKIDQREILLRCVEMFLNRDNIKQVQVVFAPEAMEEAKRKFYAYLSFTGVRMLSGGVTWMEQIVAAKEKISPDATHVVVHDAARPLVPYGDLDALLEAAEKHEAVVLASVLRNPLVEVDSGGVPVAMHPPSSFYGLLTPQAFAVAKYREMCAKKAELHPSQLHIVKGSPLNVRIGPGDGSLAKALLNILPKAKAKPLTNPFEEAQW